MKPKSQTYSYDKLKEQLQDFAREQGEGYYVIEENMAIAFLLGQPDVADIFKKKEWYTAPAQQYFLAQAQIAGNNWEEKQRYFSGNTTGTLPLSNSLISLLNKKLNVPAITTYGFEAPAVTIFKTLLNKMAVSNRNAALLMIELFPEKTKPSHERDAVQNTTPETIEPDFTKREIERGSARDDGEIATHLL